MFFRKKDSQLSRYVDVNNDFSNKELRLSMWYLKHVFTLKKIGIGLLAAWCVVTVGIGIVYFGHYLIFGYAQDKQLEAELASFPNYRNYQPLYTAVPIRLTDTKVFHAGGELYDFVTTAFNDNERYVATVFFHYDYAGTKTPQEQMLLLPGQESVLVSYGVETTRFPSNARLVIEDVAWRRVNPHKLEDVQSFITERLDIVVEELDFVKASRIEGVDAHQVRFDMINRSAYSYRNPGFHVLFAQGTQMTGAYYLELDRFVSDEPVNIDLRSFASELSVSDVRVYPIINVFDNSRYIAPGDL